jgi:hypothetical protein
LAHQGGKNVAERIAVVERDPSRSERLARAVASRIVTGIETVLPVVGGVIDQSSARDPRRQVLPEGETLWLRAAVSGTSGCDVGLAGDEREASQMLTSVELPKGIGIRRRPDVGVDLLPVIVEHVEQLIEERAMWIVPAFDGHARTPLGLQNTGDKLRASNMLNARLLHPLVRRPRSLLRSETDMSPRSFSVTTFDSSALVRS